ncbi:hypothetical protein QAD02_015300 [Eretmocerus hayati]|uniref:Uncharacterized protein n=1 Tax=Eretmocerus hayati TaxID=131215 RepID=A0ACC2P8T1_9HYME|nr:hypothetical protein QAD02_015300 [Eretmocerus hayati]
MNCRGGSHGGCQNTYLPFKLTIENGNMDAIRLFVEFGADFDEVCLDDDDGNTVLHLAAQNEDCNVLEFALSKHDINRSNLHGVSPLHFAFLDWLANVEMLIKHGADVNYPKHNMPLFDAVSSRSCREHNEEYIEVLLDSGADINCKIGKNQKVDILALALDPSIRDDTIYKLTS